jgi:hypothetical protein
MLGKIFAYNTDDSTGIYSGREDLQIQRGVKNIGQIPVSDDENNGNRIVPGTRYRTGDRKEINRIIQNYDATRVKTTHLLRLMEDHWSQNIEGGLPKLNELPELPQNVLREFFGEFYSLERDFATSCEKYPGKLAATCTLWEQFQAEVNTEIAKRRNRHGTTPVTPTQKTVDNSLPMQTLDGYIISVLDLADVVAGCFSDFSTKVLATIFAWKRVEEEMKPGEHDESKNLYFRCILLELRKQTVLCGDSGKHLGRTNVFDTKELYKFMSHPGGFGVFERKHGERVNFEWMRLGDDLETEKDSGDDEDQGFRFKRRREDDESSPESEGCSSRQPRKRARRRGLAPQQI